MFHAFIVQKMAVKPVESETEDDFGTYAGGSYRAVTMYSKGRRPISAPGRAGLPSIKRDISISKSLILESPSIPFSFSFSFKRDGGSRELDKLSQLFKGRREIELLHAYCIMHLRREFHPPEAASNFHKIWDTYSNDMIELLDVRWLISAMTTLHDHGKNPAQRMAGGMFSAFFSMIKLYEWERRVSKSSNIYTKPWQIHDMPLGMSAYSLKRGDLDYSIIARLHIAAEGDIVTKTIGHHLLALLNFDKNNIFRRIQVERKKLNR